jgi:hypothetical protein
MDTLTLLYGMTGFLCSMAFVPQITTLISDRSGAKSLSLTSLTMFTACSVISLLYAIQHNGDGAFIFCAGCGTIGNVIVLSLALLRRYQAVAPGFIAGLRVPAVARVVVRTPRVH